MGRIAKNAEVGLVVSEAFSKFTLEINEWWPKEYTWAYDVDHDIYIDLRKDGLCSETGPYGFRCDWGRVTEFEENAFIELKWQIGPNREPVPNPDRSSDVMIEFAESDEGTLISLQHFNFGNHGSRSEEYRNSMDSDKGWSYILSSFKRYCEKIEKPTET